MQRLDDVWADAATMDKSREMQCSNKTVIPLQQKLLAAIEG
jgi:hypothetical protein